jgi:hypothetical protein
MIIGAVRRSPETIGRWEYVLSKGRDVVVFCVQLDDQSTPAAPLHKAITRDFGSFERWRAARRAWRSQEVDWQNVDDALGRKAAVVAGDVQNNSVAKSSHGGATTVAPHFEAHNAQASSPSSGERSMIAGQ